MKKNRESRSFIGFDTEDKAGTKGMRPVRAEMRLEIKTLSADIVKFIQHIF